MEGKEGTLLRETEGEGCGGEVLGGAVGFGSGLARNSSSMSLLKLSFLLEVIQFLLSIVVAFLNSVMLK